MPREKLEVMRILCEDGSFGGACRRRLRYGAPSGVLGREGVSAEALAKEEALAKP